MFLEECDFDIESPLSTVYQWKTESNMYIKKSVNLVECFNNNKFGNWIPIQNGYFLALGQFEKNICESYPYSLSFISAALRLTLNQVFYSKAGEYLPVGIALMSYVNEKGIQSSVFSILVKLYRFSTCNNRFVTLYLLEIVNQIIRPLMQCNLNKNEICPEVFSLWEKLKTHFCLPEPVTIQTKSTEIYSIPQILEKRWTQIPQPHKLNSPDSVNTSNQKYITLNKLKESCTKFLKFFNEFEENINETLVRPVDFGALFGILRFADKLPNNTHKPIHMFGAANVYTEEIRSSLHMQFALSILTREAVRQHFNELQENAWRCHPLYSPENEWLRPPHCAIPEPLDDRKPKLTRSTYNILAAGPQSGEGTAKPSPLLSAIGVEGSRPPQIVGLKDSEIPETHEEYWNHWNPSSPSAESGITSVTALPAVDSERIQLPIPERVRDRQRLTHDPDADNQQHVEHEHNGAEGSNVRGISLDKQDAKLNNQQHIEHEHNEAEEGNDGEKSNNGNIDKGQNS